MNCRPAVLSTGSLPESEGAKLRFLGRKPDMDLCSALSLQKPAALWAKCIEYAHHHSKRDPEKRHSGSTSYREHQVEGGAAVWLLLILFLHKKIGRKAPITQGYQHRAALS